TGSIGLLLPGIALCVLPKGQRRLWAIPLVWFALALLPSVPYLLEDRSVQTRMFVPYLFLPAFVASAFGWAKLFSLRKEPRRVGVLLAGAVVAVLIVISVTVLFEAVRAVPG